MTPLNRDSYSVICLQKILSDKSMDVIYFESITVSLPKEQIYNRLGYSKGKTSLSSQQEYLFESYISQAQAFISLKGAGVIIPIESIGVTEIKLKNKITLRSSDLAKLLVNCEAVLLMGASAGAEIGKEIAQDSAGADVTRAVVFDATASEITDKGLDWVTNYFRRQLSRENRYLLEKRYSAGYGDFALNSQKSIYDILKLAKIGVSITDEKILVPEKSVTAITGIKSINA